MELGWYVCCSAEVRSFRFIKQFETLPLRQLRSCKGLGSKPLKGKSKKSSRLMPETTATVASAEASLTDHPAVRAWRKLGRERSVPNNIEVLKDEKRNRGVYLLNGIGPDGTSLIAKRSYSKAAAIEHFIYKEVLPQLEIPALRCHALIVDTDPEFSWLFLEDAGDGGYSSELKEHRILAGLWLGAMNVSAQRLALADYLPDRRPGSYLVMMQLARSMIREKIIDHPAFSADDIRVIRNIAFHCDFLEAHWDRIEQFCARMPQTLVHGDLSSWNARIRANHTGKKLLIMDWEAAGWGVPAADLAQFAGTALTPDIAAYWSIAHQCWPRLHLSDFRRLGELGRVFRWINVVDWANRGFHDDGTEWYIAQLRYYKPELAAWAQGTECLLELE
jgi:hypothetical protein